ncbi:MAG: deoxynucleoside kinase [Myxococcales bacterium]|nr:deoxynucleoside kinase [Myxococcales bacterium]
METAMKRIGARQRRDSPLHTESYVRDIHHLTESWVQSYADSTIVALDSAAVDWRDSKAIQTVAQEIDALWIDRYSPPTQLDLFANGEIPLNQAGTPPPVAPPPLLSCDAIDVRSFTLMRNRSLTTVSSPIQRPTSRRHSRP